MPRPPKKSDKVLDLPLFVDLPVLTQQQLSDTAKLPVLTEAVTPESPATLTPPATPLTDAQCNQVAARLAPLLETALRKKLTAYVGGQWPAVWRELEVELPALIKAELGKPAPRSKK